VHELAHRTYKVWELKNYELLYSIAGDNIREIKIRCNDKHISLDLKHILTSFLQFWFATADIAAYRETHNLSSARR
jgi:hypothetical protein